MGRVYGLPTRQDSQRIYHKEHTPEEIGATATSSESQQEILCGANSNEHSDL